MGLHGAALVHHRRAVLEVADPQGTGLVPGPAATHDFLRHAQLPPRGPLLPQVPVQGGTRKLTSELPLQDAIDRFVGAEGLLLFQGHGAVQQVAVLLSRLAPIGAAAAIQARHAFVFQPPPLATQGACRKAFPPSVGQQAFLLAQLLEIPLAPPLGNFSQQHGAQQRAPEDSPVFIVTRHKV